MGRPSCLTRVDLSCRLCPKHLEDLRARQYPSIAFHGIPIYAVIISMRWQREVSYPAGAKESVMIFGRYPLEACKEVTYVRAWTHVTREPTGMELLIIYPVIACLYMAGLLVTSNSLSNM